MRRVTAVTLQIWADHKLLSGGRRGRKGQRRPERRLPAAVRQR